ncbi:MAG: hypothetical protein OXC06_14085 [Acidimicrobiaceae bacterium]|nr:hypothetical protein [Acidimicrobiaceae bacterium]
MSRVLARAVRLVKFGAVAGALVGVGHLIVRRRRLSEAAESSWPTIAETAVQNGESIDDAAAASDDAGSDGTTGDDEAASDGDAPGDDADKS